MALPVKAKTWIISPCNRVAYVSLLGTMGAYIYGASVFLLANGYTCKFSSNGTTGPTNSADTTNRLTSAAGFAVRATIAAAAQSWIVLTDGSGIQILITYQGASDDIARISFSAGGFTLAGTTTQQPTATDEQLVTSATSLILATTSGDRLWSGWVMSGGIGCRFAVARAGVWTGLEWGVEVVNPVTFAAGVTWSPPVWGFAHPPGNANGVTTSGLMGAASASARGGVARPTVGGSGVNASLAWGGEGQAASPLLLTSVGNVSCEMQGDYLIAPATVGSTTTGARGKFGNLFDHYFSGETGAGGQVFGANLWINMTGTSSAAPLMWPWDGSAVVMT